MPYVGAGSKFFRDQDVLKEDLFNIEYTKIKMLRDTTQRTMSSPGVCALSRDDTVLQVSLDDVSSFSVNPGYAVDGYGRLVYIPSSTSASGSIVSDPYYHPAWPDRTAISHSINLGPGNSATYYVHLSYATQEDIMETDDEGSQFYTRNYDSYNISVSTQASSSGNSIILASFLVNDQAASSLVDRRSFYSALSPTSTTIEGHQRNYHEDGIGDNEPPAYELGISSAYAQKSLGLTITHAGTSATATLNSIESFVNLNGIYLTGELSNHTIGWVDADTTGYYVIYLDTDKFVRRTSVNDFSAAQLATSFPLFHVYWSDSNELTIVADLRKWNVADTWVGNVQVSSGSLFLNSGSLGNKSGDCSINFIDDQATLSYLAGAGEFHISKTLKVDANFYGSNVKAFGNLLCNGSIFVNSDGGDGDSYLYFYEGSSTGAYLKWDDSSTRFEVSHDLLVNEKADASSDDVILYFCGTSPQTLKWDSTNSRFEFGQNVLSLGSFISDGDVYVDADSSSNNAKLFFHGSTYNLQWNSPQTRFEFSHKVAAPAVYVPNSGADAVIVFDGQNGDFVGGDYGTIGQLSSGRLKYDIGGASPETYHSFTVQDDEKVRIDSNGVKSNLNMFINYGGPDQDSYLYFYEGSSASGAYLLWDDNPGNFYFNKSLYISGDLEISNNLTVNGVVTDSLTISSYVDASSYIRGSELRSEGNIHVNYAGPDGDSYLYFYDGNPYARWMKWDNADNRFEFNRTIYTSQDMIADTVTASDVIVSDDLTVTDRATFGELNVPTSRPSSPALGDMYVDTVNNRLYVRMTAGWWHYFIPDFVEAE